MRRFQCHKVVEAAKIVDVQIAVDHDPGIPFARRLLLEGGDVVDLESRHKPEPGGYFVRYADGYASYSPAKAFEEGYTEIADPVEPSVVPLDAPVPASLVPVPGHSFGWAIKMLHGGKLVSRGGWNGKGQYLGLQVPDAHSANTLPYIWIRTVQGDRVPWLASQTDMLAVDWRVVEG